MNGCAVVHTHNGIVLAIKKNERMPFSETQMDLCNIILSKVSLTKTTYDMTYKGI